MSLRVLVINGFRSDPTGLRKCKSFVRVVQQALRVVGTRSEFHMSLVGIQDLEQFVYDQDTNEKTRVQALRNFSSTDITFIAGESDLVPWHPKAALLLAYVNQCVISGACVYGDEVAMRMVWHLACTCGRQLQVIDALNVQGEDGSTALASELPKAFCGSKSVMVDELTGETYQFHDGSRRSSDAHLNMGEGEEGEEDRAPAFARHKRAAPIRVCNVGMRRREGHNPGGVDPPDPSGSLTIIKGRGLEQHWLMTKIPSKLTGKQKLEGFKHKWPRIYDINSKFDPTRAGLNPVQPFQGMAMTGFRAPIKDSPKNSERTPSAKCRQPDRNFTVLGSSSYGPEMLECGSMLCVNWGIYKLQAEFPALVIGEFVKHWVHEPRPRMDDEGPWLGDTAMRDKVFQRLQDVGPMLDRFTFGQFLHACSVDEVAEFGGGCEDVIRQLFREGVLPLPHQSETNAFVSLKKIPKVKFQRQEFGATGRSEDKKEEATKSLRIRRESIAAQRMASGRGRSQSVAAGERVVVVRVPKGAHSNYHKMLKSIERSESALAHIENDPYKTPWEHNLALDHESRKHWVSSRDFKVTPCEASPPTKMITNYVNLSPWEGEPETVWGKIVKSHKEYPPEEWVGDRGMRFNFSVKTPGSQVLEQRRQVMRSHYPVQTLKGTTTLPKIKR